MAKIKLTKNELRKQKDNLARFKRYLPTLQLKKQQLQFEIHAIESKHREVVAARKSLETAILKWVDVFGEDEDVVKLIKIKRVITESGNVAGIDIPVYKGVEFDDISYDLFLAPLWIDRAVDELMKIFQMVAELKVLERQAELLKEELRTTSQRVNLFEKVKIPESQKNIRMIQIYMGDQQTAAVVRGKISKKKIVRV